MISFLPALAYWYLEENYPLKIAIIGGLGLAVLEIILEKIFFKHIHSISKFNFFLLLFLGGLSLLGDEGIWFKLQPMFTGLGIGGFLFFKKWRGESLFLEIMETMNNKKNLPDKLVFLMEYHIAIFMMGYGLFMGGVALFLSTGYWTFFKTIGFYLAFVLFCLFEVVLIRRIVKKERNSLSDKNLKF